MKIKKAIVLGAGFGKRMYPITKKIPKPLITINNITLLENTIKFLNSLGVKHIIINVHHLHNKMTNFIKLKKFSSKIDIVVEKKKILNTGGGILNLINHSEDDDFIIFNPDTLWHLNYLKEIIQMQDFYFSKKLNNILLTSKKELSFDKNLLGDFMLKNNFLEKNENNDLIYIGCQILNKSLFKEYKVSNFPISIDLRWTVYVEF